MSELKPCPFCGESVSISRSYYDNVNFPFIVRCMNCRAEGGLHSSENEAITAWNTRAALSQPSVEAELTRLRRQVEVLREGIENEGHAASGIEKHKNCDLCNVLVAADKISNGGEIRHGDASTRKDEDWSDHGGVASSAPSPTHTREELVEVIARALCISDGENPNHRHSVTGRFHWVVYARDAKAALDALIAIGAVRVK